MIFSASCFTEVTYMLFQPGLRPWLCSDLVGDDIRNFTNIFLKLNQSLFALTKLVAP